METNPGIYKIVNTINQKVYVGSSSNPIKIRWYQHKSNLKRNKGNRHLQHAWDKYGEGAFSFEVIENVSDPELLIERENYWIDYYDSCNRLKGYNICPALAPTITVNRNEKISNTLKGRPLSEEHKAKLKGKVRSEEYKAKMREIKMGTKWTDNQRKLMEGRKMTQEQKDKISQAHKDGKMSKPPSHKGIKRSEEFKRKLSESRMGSNNPNYKYKDLRE